MTRLLRLQAERIEVSQARARTGLLEQDRLMAELRRVQAIIAGRKP